ncbi:hypothetical protein AJ88_43405 [Mesorhizobium amorphae CCBAU 01583]|nr:hypothetical protein AJ88_43405 [Mesorhizobium amorphae CCBAU 01583]
MERVNNTVRLKLWKGNVIVAGRKGPNSLTARPFKEDSVYDQRDAHGFINLTRCAGSRAPRPAASS